MRLSEFVKSEMEELKENVRVEYGIDATIVMEEILKELTLFKKEDWESTYKIYEMFDYVSKCTYEHEEEINIWYRDDVRKRNLGYLLNSIETALYENVYDSVEELFDRVRSEMRYNAFRNNDIKILQLMCAFYLMKSDYTEINDDFFDDMCRVATDNMFEDEHINISHIFCETLGGCRWDMEEIGNIER